MLRIVTLTSNGRSAKIEPGSRSILVTMRFGASASGDLGVLIGLPVATVSVGVALVGGTLVGGTLVSEIDPVGLKAGPSDGTSTVEPVGTVSDVPGLTPGALLVTGATLVQPTATANTANPGRSELVARRASGCPPHLCARTARRAFS